jgi:hypothetical protein
LKKINELYCLHEFPLNQSQANEIQAFRALISKAPHHTAAPVHRVVSVKPVTHTTTIETSTTTCVNTVQAATSSTCIDVHGVTQSKGQNKTGIMAALFTAPTSMMNALQCLYEFLLILIVLYILGSVLEDVLYKKEDLTAVKKRFYTKWTTIAVGLVVAFIIAYLLNEWCLLLPLVIALVLSLVWMILFPKHATLKGTAKSWKLTSATKVKTEPVSAVAPVAEKK